MEGVPYCTWVPSKTEFGIARIPMEVSSELAREVVLRDDVRHVEERENGFKFVTLDGQDHEGIPIK